MQTYIAAAYWGPRAELVDMCASRANVCIDMLAKISECFTGWRALGRSRAEAIEGPPLDLSTALITELFLQGKNRKDVGREVIEELGFHLAVWNGKENESASALSMTCGLHSNAPGLSNAIVLKVPSQFDETSANQIKAVMMALIEAWDPDWAVFSTRSALSDNMETGPYLDKALYLRDDMASSRDVPSASQKLSIKHGFLFLA